MRAIYLLLLLAAALPALHAVSSEAWLEATLVEDLAAAATAENEVMIGSGLTASMDNMPAGEYFDAEDTFHMEGATPTMVPGSYAPADLWGPAPIPAYDQRAPLHMAYWNAPPSLSTAAARMYATSPDMADAMTAAVGEDMVTAPSFVEADAEWRGARKNSAFHVGRRLRGGAAARPAYGYNNPAYGPAIAARGYAGQVTDVHPCK